MYNTGSRLVKNNQSPAGKEAGGIQSIARAKQQGAKGNTAET
jgi:hypothetical protein